MKSFLRAWNLHDVLRETARSLRQFGFRRTLAIARSRLGDYSFDTRYGTDTVEPIPLSELDIPYASVGQGRRYQPTGVKAFELIMNALDLQPGEVFVDFGSGKGRALMLAARYPFGRIVGVEFSEGLCAIARANIKKFLAKESVTASMEIVHVDATMYAFKDDETVFYFFLPFSEEIFQRVLRNLNESLNRKPRKAWLIYNCADDVTRTVIEKNTSFVFNCVQIVGGYDCVIFSNMLKGL